MDRSDIKGKAQTVLGLIDGSELGITLPHEHFFIDSRCYIVEPTDPEEKKLAHQKLTLENLWYARSHNLTSYDNLLLDDEEMAIREAMYFKEAGGKTIVDLTCISGHGRNPEGLVNIAKATGLSIIMGTAYYIARSYTPEAKIDSRTEEDIAEEFIREITVGVGDTGIKAGILGENGISWPMRDGERKVLRAAGIAQQETGAAINIHLGGCEDSPFECIKILEEVGADLSRVVFSHMGRTIPISSRATRARLAEKGCYLEYDGFGFDVTYPTKSPEMCPYDRPNDEIRMTLIMELIEDGFLNQILVSQDVAWKVILRSYGGQGYGHILRNIVPRMRAKGMTEEQINTILVANPRRVNTFV
ncbi:phosphotriesterase [Chloroflexota bacterium]